MAITTGAQANPSNSPVSKVAAAQVSCMTTSQTRKPVGAPGSTGGQFDGRQSRNVAGSLPVISDESRAFEETVIRSAAGLLTRSNRDVSYTHLRDYVQAFYPDATNMYVSDGDAWAETPQFEIERIVDSNGRTLWDAYDAKIGQADTELDPYVLTSRVNEIYNEWDDRYMRETAEIEFGIKTVWNVDTTVATPTSLIAENFARLEDAQLEHLEAQIHQARIMRASNV